MEFLFAPEEWQAPPVTPKTAQLFECVSVRMQQLMQNDVHPSRSQVTSKDASAPGQAINWAVAGTTYLADELVRHECSLP